MQPIVRKTKKRRSLLPLLLLLLLCAAALTFYMLKQEELVDPDTLPDPYTYGELFVHNEDEVISIAASLANGNSWKLLRQDNGSFSPEGSSWTITDNVRQSLLRVTAAVTYDDIVSDDRTEYADRLDNFGLDKPSVISVTYSDGTACTLRFGNSLDLEEENLCYMTADGDDRLFVVAKGTADALCIELSSMHPVIQPSIEKARIDRITIQSETDIKEWQLVGSVTDADATDSWLLTSPYIYPADGTSLTNLRQNLSQLRMGAYVCDADEASLAEYGLLSPQQTIIVHMAEALVNETDEDGTVSQVLRSEETVRIDLGAMKNDYVRYVAFDGAVYTCSSFTLTPVTDIDTAGTVSRYTVTVSLSSLTQLICTVNGTETIWKVTPATDETDGTCSRNGEAFDYTAFEAAYARLENVTVSGRLPDGWQAEETAHTRFVFQTDTGMERTLELVSFDALHDAVIMDGHALFYLIKNGLKWDL